MQVEPEMDYVFNLSKAYQLPVDYHLTHGLIPFWGGGGVLTGMDLKQNSCFVCEALVTGHMKGSTGLQGFACLLKLLED